MIALNLTVTRTHSLDKERSVQMQTVSVRWNVSLNVPMAAPARTVDVSVRLDSPVQRAMTVCTKQFKWERKTSPIIQCLLSIMGTSLNIPVYNCFVDVDECALLPTNHCQFNCQNTFGSYHCVCWEGFTLGPDKRTCIGWCTCNLTTWFSFILSISKFIIFFFTEEHAQCFPGCMNGGVCRGGKCRCPRGFSGGLCQEGMQICILFFIFICTMADQKLLIHLLL